MSVINTCRYYLL